MGLAVERGEFPTKEIIQVVKKCGLYRTGSVPVAWLQPGCQKSQSIIRTPLISYFSCFISLFLVLGREVFSFTAELVQQEPEIHPIDHCGSLSVCRGEHSHCWKAILPLIVQIRVHAQGPEILFAQPQRLLQNTVFLWEYKVIESALVPTMNRDFIWEGRDAAFDLNWKYSSEFQVNPVYKALSFWWVCLKLSHLCTFRKYSEIYFPASFPGPGWHDLLMHLPVYVSKMESSFVYGKDLFLFYFFSLN